MWHFILIHRKPWQSPELVTKLQPVISVHLGLFFWNMSLTFCRDALVHFEIALFDEDSVFTIVNVRLAYLTLEVDASVAKVHFMPSLLLNEEFWAFKRSSNSFLLEQIIQGNMAVCRLIPRSTV